MSTTQYIWHRDAVRIETVNSSLDVSYARHPGDAGNLVSEMRDGQTYCHHYDAIGTTRSLTNSNEDITDTFSYSAFGTETSREGVTPTSATWIGRFGYERVSQTVFSVRRRVYSPFAMRWLTSEPAQTVSGVNRATISPYVYALNMPVDRVVPSGIGAGVLASLLLFPELPEIEITPPTREPPLPPIPTLPPGTDPSEFLCEIIREEWTEQLCQKCPPCTCAGTPSGKSRITEAQYESLFKSLKTTMGVSCPVKLVVKAQCVNTLPEFAITCPTGTAGKPASTICVPTTLDYCRGKALLIHELVHAKQICSGSTRTRVQREQEAYRKQCEELHSQQCLNETQSKSAKKKWLNRCVANFTSGSTNPANVAKFAQACTTLTAPVK